MKPWFEKEILEGDVIKFPEPKEKVIQMPNIASYPDFLTGVKDLQNRLSDGQISQESYDRLCAELIQRFMKKEDVETPWFMESPEGIMSLTKQLQNLPPDTDPAILDKINDYIQLAQDKKADPEANIYKKISRKVKGNVRRELAALEEELRVGERQVPLDELVLRHDDDGDSLLLAIEALAKEEEKHDDVVKGFDEYHRSAGELFTRRDIDGLAEMLNVEKWGFKKL